MSKLGYKCETDILHTLWFSTTASEWKGWADAHRRLITVRERERCAIWRSCLMNVGISEEMSVDAPVTQYVIALSFFLQFSISLFVSLSDCLSQHCISFFLMSFWLFCLTYTHKADTVVFLFCFLCCFSSILFKPSAHRCKFL